LADTVDPVGPTHSPSSSIDELIAQMAQARLPDPVGLRLAHARISEALFGTVAASGLGRFRVLERLGAGGMGVVYSAYDPDLDRGVALKVVHVPARSRDAALAEAKALARLSHPNVVPVYDVGVEDEHVYIVMELVRGQTLARWVQDRTRREILDAYRQAGDALAAAHAAGLVHRDFKPDNAIVGNDGRVRVVDFGLACEAADPRRGLDQSPPVAGTPRYMAPEQAAGAAVTPAVDQYSFCVALDEALSAGAKDNGPAPLPRWIAAVLERGRAADPAARFSSMGELLRGLAHDPARMRRRRVALAALALLGAGAFVAGRESLGRGADACGGGDAELAAAWAPAARASSLARMASVGPYGRALAQRLEQTLQEHAHRWTAEHRDACVAHRRGVQSDALFDRRMACLARGRAALTAVAEIVDRADANHLPEVALAARALPDPAGCSDVNALVSNVEPPPPSLSARVAQMRDALARARVQIAAGRFADARAAAHRNVADARALGYRPLLAEALLVEGHAKMMQARPSAVPLLAEATTVALAVGADTLAVEAWARRAWAQGTENDPTSALAGVDLVAALAARADSGRFARALFYNNVGTVELAQEHRDRAQVDFEQALIESRGVAGAGAIELVGVRSNLALVTDDPARREALLGEADAELERLLGADHPMTLHGRWVHGMATKVQLRPAAEFLTPVCEGDELHADTTAEAARCWSEVGFVRGELGDADGAIAAFTRAVRIGAALTDVPEMAANLAFWRGDAADAARQLVATLAQPQADDPPWWLHLYRAKLELALGRARRRLGQWRGAREALEASVAELTMIVRNHPTAAYERRLGRARAELAMTLAALASPTAEVAPVAAAAAAWLRQAEGSGREIAVLERLAAD
jgi:predicted Ser/Thr protein kinase/tetratricopeptide (TPR) repeat protein